MTRANIDQALVKELFSRYAGTVVQERLDRVGKPEMRFAAFAVDRSGTDPTALDEFQFTGVERVEHIKAIFDRYFFGCEADDRVNAVAFDDGGNPMATELNAMLSSDIGRFDVRDITRVLAEAYELVQEGPMDHREFQAFTFDNAVRIWTPMNTEFFAGTAVAKAVSALTDCNSI
jgi:hypothetical protein